MKIRTIGDMLFEIELNRAHLQAQIDRRATYKLCAGIALCLGAALILWLR